MEHEQAATAGFSGRRIVALCSYALTQCNDQQMSEVMLAHHCMLERPDANWQVVAGPDALHRPAWTAQQHPAGRRQSTREAFRKIILGSTYRPLATVSARSKIT